MQSTLDESNPNHTGTRELLIVEDEGVTALHLRQHLEKLGYTITAVAVSGEEALRVLEQSRPDLVLMDVHMPGMGGPEATRRIMSQNTADPPVVVLLSTYDAADFGTRALECGAVAYLAKGEFGPDVLRAAWIAARPEQPGA